MAQSGPTLASAYVKIVPTTKGFKSALEGDEEFSGAGESAGRGFAGKLIGTAAKMFAVANIGKAIGDSIKQGAALQQSLGGVETLFKQNADKVKAYAKEAYRTSGVSANDYMENVTSFSASLISSLGGNTAKAAEVANMAMIDMSDNANKMGTDMGAIQTAYQGFAKQNYTMLDNLKLGRQSHTIAEYKLCENGETLMVT